jgi:hypothetical protein
MSSKSIPWLALVLFVVCTGCSSSTTSDVVVVDASPGSSSADATATDLDGGTCGTSLSSCLTVKCCDGLVCCSGTPIPPGQAYCYPSMCPY